MNKLILKNLHLPFLITVGLRSIISPQNLAFESDEQHYSHLEPHTNQDLQPKNRNTLLIDDSINEMSLKYGLLDL